MEDLDSGEILSKATAYNGTERMPGAMWRISECPGWLLRTLFFSDYGYSILALKNIRALVVQTTVQVALVTWSPGSVLMKNKKVYRKVAFREKQHYLHEPNDGNSPRAHWSMNG